MPNVVLICLRLLAQFLPQPSEMLCPLKYINIYNIKKMYIHIYIFAYVYLYSKDRFCREGKAKVSLPFTG